MARTVIPVILCGGSGARLWPASRESHPKQFLRLMGDYSLLQDTAMRALRVAGGNAANLVTVTLDALSQKVLSQLAEINPAATQHVLCEPAARNTAAAVAFAASYVSRTFGDDTYMWVLPADHHIGDEKALAEAFGHGLEVAENGYLTTFGIRPVRPETGYGYIRLGASISGINVRAAEAFVEKPDEPTARAYIEAGNYLWNSGMFLFSTRAILDEYVIHAAEILNDVRMSMENGFSRQEAAKHPYAIIPDQPFDKAIMEKSSRVAVVPCDPGWSDIGSWESLWEMRRKDDHGNVTEGRIACHETRNCLIQGKSRLIACAGVENIIVIETSDAILIAGRNKGDDMRQLVKTLKKTGISEVTHQKGGINAWSMRKSPRASQDYNMKKILIEAGQSHTFEPHSHAVRFWIVAEGQGRITIGNDMKPTRLYESVFIPRATIHSIDNTGAGDLRIIEVSRNSGGVLRLGRERPRRKVA